MSRWVPETARCESDQSRVWLWNLNVHAAAAKTAVSSARPMDCVRPWRCCPAIGRPDVALQILQNDHCGDAHGTAFRKSNVGAVGFAELVENLESALHGKEKAPRAENSIRKPDMGGNCKYSLTPDVVEGFYDVGGDAELAPVALG